MRRGHTPFGYRIEKGCAVVDETQAEQIQKIYAGYLSGRGYIDAAKVAGLSMTHSSVKRLLQNKHYLGDDFYPAIIDRETFDAAEAERQRRVELLGRSFTKETVEEQRRIPTCFTIGTITEEHEDPYEQAAYIYGLVESEEKQWHQ